MALTPLPQMGSLQPAAFYLLEFPFGGWHAGASSSSSPAEWVSGALFLWQMRQDWDGLERGILNFLSMEHQRQKELSQMWPKDKESYFLLKEVEHIVA